MEPNLSIIAIEPFYERISFTLIHKHSQLQLHENAFFEFSIWVIPWAWQTYRLMNRWTNNASYRVAHTHSKSIKNAFGHLDNLLRQAGPRVLKKTVQSMQISSTKDLVFDSSNSWQKMPVPKRKQLKDVQEKWKSSQQKLIDHGVKDSDANALQHQDADKIDSINEKTWWTTQQW